MNDVEYFMKDHHIEKGISKARLTACTELRVESIDNIEAKSY